MGPDLNQFRARYEYHLDTGRFSHKTTIGGTIPGVPLSETPHRRYLLIKILHKKYKAHKLAWFWVTGVWPERIDHRNLDKKNNTWNNLREATNSQNAQNTKIMKTNTSGFRGVDQRSHKVGGGKYKKMWRARIALEGNRITIGTYETAEEASRAYEESAKKMYGEFYRPPDPS